MLFILCGCAQKSKTAPVLNDISFETEISYGQHKYSGDVTLADDILNLTVTAPKEIKGLTLKLDENGVTAKFKGISIAPDIDSLPQGAVGNILFGVLNDAKSKTIEHSEDNCEIKGMIDGCEYVFVFSPSGLPISLKVDKLELEIEFKNVTVN